VAEFATVRASVVGKERRSPHREEERDDIVILHALPRDVMAELAHGETLGAKQFALISRDVLVEDVHAGAGSTT
jgi:hypothetical protein